MSMICPKKKCDKWGYEGGCPDGIIHSFNAECNKIFVYCPKCIPYKEETVEKEMFSAEALESCVGGLISQNQFGSIMTAIRNYDKPKSIKQQVVDLILEIERADFVGGGGDFVSSKVEPCIEKLKIIMKDVTFVPLVATNEHAVMLLDAYGTVDATKNWKVVAQAFIDSLRGQG